MFPSNAREGDFVEVSNNGHTYYGMVGRIKKLSPSKVTVDIYGKSVDIEKDDLSLRARAGTSAHDAWVEQISSRELAHLDESGYNGLIDFAIDNNDWEWAKDLVNRKNEYLAKRKVKK